MNRQWRPVPQVWVYVVLRLVAEDSIIQQFEGSVLIEMYTNLSAANAKVDEARKAFEDKRGVDGIPHDGGTRFDASGCMSWIASYQDHDGTIIEENVWVQKKRLLNS